MTRRRAVARVLTVAAVLAALAGCGLPADGDSRRIETKDVPYGLLAPAPTATPATTPDEASQRSVPRTYLLDDVRLVPVRAPLPKGLPAQPDQELPLMMKLLSGGPTETQRAAGLSTALTPGVVIDVLGTKGGVALLQVESQVKDPPADRLPLAIGQIVLTATAVPGVNAVQLIRDGVPVEVPLPGGALTSQPLSRADYRELLLPVAVPSPTSSGSSSAG